MTSLLHHSHLAIPDICAGRCLKYKAVIGVERGRDLFYLYSPSVQFISPTDMKQSCTINIIAVGISTILETTGFATRMDDHLALEDQEEMIRFLVLNHSNLNRGSPKFVI